MVDTYLSSEKLMHEAKKLTRVDSKLAKSYKSNIFRIVNKNNEKNNWSVRVQNSSKCSEIKPIIQYTFD